MGDSNPQEPKQPMQGYQDTQATTSQGIPVSSVNMPYQADTQTQQMIANMNAMKQSGVFQTPYEKLMANHPIQGTIGTGLMAMGQGITKQPYLTDYMSNQTALKNTAMSGMNSIASLPAQMRMMMAMQGSLGQGGKSQNNIPGVPSNQNTNPLISKIQAAKAAGYSDEEIQSYISGRK